MDPLSKVHVGWTELLIFHLRSYSVCVASIVRVTTFDQFTVEDPLYTTVLTSIWTSVEQSLGIVCACLPVLKPLFGRALNFSTHRDDPAEHTSTSNPNTIGMSKRNIKSRWRALDESDNASFARLREEELAGIGLEALLGGEQAVAEATVSRNGPKAPVQPHVKTNVTSGSPVEDVAIPAKAIMKNLSIEQRYDNRSP